MVVIGDAAPGASMAIEDAVILARCLRDRPAIPDALDAYENTTSKPPPFGTCLSIVMNGLWCFGTSRSLEAEHRVQAGDLEDTADRTLW
jgi:hypothetical protein